MELIDNLLQFLAAFSGAVLSGIAYWKSRRQTHFLLLFCFYGCYYEKSIFLDIVSGRKAISSFDTFVEQWNKLGGADWTKEVNDWYQSKK